MCLEPAVEAMGTGPVSRDRVVCTCRKGYGWRAAWVTASHESWREQALSRKQMRAGE